MNSPSLPRASLGSDSLWLSANFDDFQSPTGTTTGTKISGPIGARCGECAGCVTESRRRSRQGAFLISNRRYECSAERLGGASWQKGTMTVSRRSSRRSAKRLRASFVAFLARFGGKSPGAGATSWLDSSSVLPQRTGDAAHAERSGRTRRRGITHLREARAGS